jgi:hypothetical protein
MFRYRLIDEDTGGDLGRSSPDVRRRRGAPAQIGRAVRRPMAMREPENENFRAYLVVRRR